MTTEMYYVAGREIGVFGRRVRAPLPLLMRPADNVRAYTAETRGIVAHRTAYGAFWFEREFRSHRDAARFAADIAEAFGGVSIAEKIDRASGRPRHAGSDRAGGRQMAVLHPGVEED